MSSSALSLTWSNESEYRPSSLGSLDLDFGFSTDFGALTVSEISGFSFHFILSSTCDGSVSSANDSRPMAEERCRRVYFFFLFDKTEDLIYSMID